MLAVLVCVSIAASAQQAQTPNPRVADSHVINAEQLIKLALAHPEMVIIDSRMATDRKHGFIEGSTSLADVDTDCYSLARFVPSTSTPVAFYCNGPKCNRSAVASDIAAKCGYQQSYWFRGGLDEWVNKGYPTLAD